MKLDGELKEYRCDGEDADLFRCLTCSLGTFGIIVSVRLQVSPLFYLSLRQHALDFHSFLNTMPVHCSSSDHFRYMWYPHTNSGIAFHLMKQPPTSIDRRTSFFSRFTSWFRQSLIGQSDESLSLSHFPSPVISCLQVIIFWNGCSTCPCTFHRWSERSIVFT